MTDEEAIEEIKRWASGKKDLEHTFAYSLSPYCAGRFEEDWNGYDGSLAEFLEDMLDVDVLYDIYSETLIDVANWEAWFRLNTKAFKFFRGIIKALKDGKRNG